MPTPLPNAPEERRGLCPRPRPPRSCSRHAHALALALLLAVSRRLLEVSRPLVSKLCNSRRPALGVEGNKTALAEEDGDAARERTLRPYRFALGGVVALAASAD